MARTPRRSRRTVLGSIAATLAVAAGLPSVAGAGDRDEDRRQSRPTEGARSDRALKSYVGQVDRIVDGDHVVILLEEDGELVDQIVVPREDLSQPEEGDFLIVLLRRGEFLTARPLPDRFAPR